MNISSAAFILGLSIVGAVFVNNFFASDRYSFHYVGNENYNNFYTSYVTDRMTGTVERVTYSMIKNEDNKSKVDSEEARTINMRTGLFDVNKIKYIYE